jgi:AAHS family 4-hydroxybenzoate transporter-like MFS transporter
MNEINVSRLVDTSKLRPFHFWLTFWCLLAIMADGFDLLNASIAGPALIKEWNISRASLGPVFSASFFGFFIGAPFFGYLGDRYGRKLTIIISLICLGLATLACAFATNLHELLWLRFLSGIGLGGVIPNVIALNSEFAPKRLRATFLVVISMGISLGGSIPGIVGVTLMPTYGWPIIFIVGGIVPMVVGLLMIFAVPESIKFLVLRGGRDETVRRLIHRVDPDLTVVSNTRFVLDSSEGSAKTRGSVIELFRGGWAVVTILVWLIFILNLMSNNLLNAWLPMIVQTSGHSAEQGAYAGTLYQLGGSFGGLVSQRIFRNNDLIAAGIGCRPQFLDLICRHGSGIIAPSAAHKRQDFRDLLIVQLNAELRHAVRIRHAFHDKRFRAVQHEIDERRRVRVEHGRVACQRRHEWRLALAVGAMTSGA